MPSCILCSRTRNAKSVSSNITFHKIPSDENIKKKWIDFILLHGCNITTLNKYSVVCSVHFDSSVFINYKRTKQLQKSAVPSIVISRVKSAKHKYPEWVENTAILLSSSTSSISEISKVQSDIIVKQPGISTEINMEQPVVKISSDNMSISGVSPLNDNFDSKQITTLVELSEFNIEHPEVKKNTTNLYLGVCQPATTDTSNHLFLKRSIAILSKKLATSTKNVKVLQQKLKWQYHKLTLLKQIVFQLKEKNKINDDASKMLLNNFGSLDSNIIQLADSILNEDLKTINISMYLIV